VCLIRFSYGGEERIHGGLACLALMCTLKPLVEGASCEFGTVAAGSSEARFFVLSSKPWPLLGRNVGEFFSCT
jgi:hypothetical protein